MVFWWLLCQVTWAMFQPYEDCQIPWTGQSTSIDGTVDAGETTSQHLKHGIVSTINNQKNRTMLKRINKPCKQAKYGRLQLVVLVICGYMLPASTFGAWTFNLFITKPLYNLVSWESARRVFWETLSRPTKMQTSTLHCHHRHRHHHHQSYNCHLQSWNLTPTSKSRWPSHILYDVLYVSQCTQCWPRFIPSP